MKKLIEILQKLVNQGNSVMVIEHNLDLVKCADYIIDIGPDGGLKGGDVIAKGTPEEVAENKDSYTGHYLKKSIIKTSPSVKYQGEDEGSKTVDQILTEPCSLILVFGTKRR